MFISVFHFGVEGGQEKIRKQKLFSYLGPGRSGGEGAFPGSVTHFLPQPEFSLHGHYCPQGGKGRGREPPCPVPYK